MRKAGTVSKSYFASHAGDVSNLTHEKFMLV
jgi:hypothetical protein